MSLGRYSFKLNDATRLVRALKAAGLSITRVELDNGKVVAVTTGATSEDALDASAVASDRIETMRAKGKRQRG